MGTLYCSRDNLHCGPTFVERIRRILLVVVGALALIAGAPGPALAIQDGDPCSCPNLGKTGKVCTNGNGTKVCSCQPSAVGGTCGAQGFDGRVFRALDLYLGAIADAEKQIAKDKKLIQTLQDSFGPLTTTHEDANALALEIRAAQELLQRDTERVAEIQRGGIAPFMPYAEPPRTKDWMAKVLAGGGQSRSQANRLASVPVDPDARISFFGGTDVARSSASSVTGYTSGGLPTATAGFSSVSTSSGGGLRFDLGGPLHLGPDQRFVVVAGAWANTLALESPASLANFGVSGGARSLGASVGLGAGYALGANYVKAVVLSDTSRTSLNVGGFGGAARFGAHGFAADLSAGHYFNLWSARAAGIALLADGWKTAGLDASGHVGNARQRGHGFTDAFGNVFSGTGGNVWTLGLSARLSALYKAGDVLLTPFAKIAFDVAPESKFWSYAPIWTAAGALPTGIFAFDRRMGAVEGGLEVGSLRGVALSSSVRYELGSTTKTVGGRLTLKAPLN